MFSSPQSLTRRSLNSFFLFGLAGLFTFLVASLLLAWQGMLTSSAAFAVILPLLIMCGGGWYVRSQMRTNSIIEEQLVRLSETEGDTLTLQPLLDAHPVAAGWNRIREAVETSKSWEAIEHRLNANSANSGIEYREILDHLSDGIVVSDEDGRITLVNPATEVLLKTEDDEEEFTDRNMRELLLQQFPNEAETLKAKFSKPLPKVVVEVKKGEELADGVLRISRTRIARNNAEAICVWTLRDVTQQKLADDMRSQFVFTATHELRTPLTNLKALAETLALEDQVDVEDQKRFCNMINAEATRLSRFVDELLNISQIESGAMQISKTETDVERLLAEVVEHVQPEIERKRIAFNAKLPAKLPKLDVDKDKIIAAIVNLLGNAVKYTPEGGRVEFVVKSADGRLVIDVEDSGYGISPEEVGRVFDKFFRSDDERVRQESGTGLGLAFTREVLRMHGGNVTVTSELGKGSRFSASLPVAE